MIRRGKNSTPHTILNNGRNRDLFVQIAAG